MKILILCSGLDVAGGYEKMVCSLANGLHEKGKQVSLLITGRSTGSFYPIHKDISKDHCLVDFGIGGSGNYLSRKLRFVSDINTIRTRIHSVQPQVVLSTEYPVSVAAAAANFSTSFRQVCWHHNAFDNAKSLFWDRATKMAFRRAAMIVALNSEEQAKYARYNNRTVVIPNFIAESTGSAALDAKRILTIARADAVKGLDHLLKAARLLAVRYPEWQWKLISDVQMEEQYASEIREVGIPSNLHIAPAHSSDTDNEYLAASIYALTSRRELFPMVLLEAQAKGVPAVAFDCPSGPRHIITHNEDGLLVAKDNPVELAEGIGRLIEDVSKRKEMGTKAFAHAKRFYKEPIMEQWEQLMARLLQPAAIHSPKQ